MIGNEAFFKKKYMDGNLESLILHVTLTRIAYPGMIPKYYIACFHEGNIELLNT